MGKVGAIQFSFVPCSSLSKRGYIYSLSLVPAKPITHHASSVKTSKYVATFCYRSSESTNRLTAPLPTDTSSQGAEVKGQRSCKF